MKKPTVSSKGSLKQVQALAARAGRYAVPGFIVLVVGIYGMLLLRIQSLSNAPPSGAAVVNESSKTRAPKIDENVLRQLQSLQDNSVSVQTLFEEARTNPFQ